jgi:predicted Zn-dependent protease
LKGSPEGLRYRRRSVRDFMRRWAIALTLGALGAVAAATWSSVATRRTGSVEGLRDLNTRRRSAARISTTSRADLDRTVATMNERLNRNPTDAAAAVALADALLRQTRVTGNAGLASHAESALKAVLADEPMDYGARRMLAAVYLSQHRFGDAIREADRCRTMRARDAWLEGVLGDAHLELGEYDAAFDAFDRMTTARPDAASYARASYARELQGISPGRCA